VFSDLFGATLGLDSLAKRRGYDVGVGVVRRGAFSGIYKIVEAVECCIAGFGLPGIRGVIVEEGLPLVAAHEIGHSFGLFHNDLAANGYWITEGRDYRDSSSLMSAQTSADQWIAGEDYLKLLDGLSPGGLRPTSNEFMYGTLEEEGHKLYLHMYDSQERHVGFNRESQGVETEVPGSYYWDFGRITIIVLPTSAEKLRVVVDGTQATDQTEEYVLFLASVSPTREMVSNFTITDSVKRGEDRAYRLTFNEDRTLRLESLAWWQDWRVWAGVGATLFAVGAFLALRRRAKPRESLSRQAGPRVKEIRSTIGKPQVKSIQETGRKPRVLKVEEE
jgi:hypothetical protein